jgi:PXPV repeat (3 copies)
MTMKNYPVLPGAVAALALAACLAATPATARDRLSPGAAAALGVLGGLAVGGAIAASQAPVYAAPAPVYVEPRPVYVSPPPPPVIVERCYIERSSEYVPGWGWQPVHRRVCD